MANVSIDKQLNVKITLDVSESEARAMEALAGYGTKPFLNVFYKHMGRHYLEPHESGLTSLFSKIRTQLPRELTAIDNARKELDAPTQNNVSPTIAAVTETMGALMDKEPKADKCVTCALRGDRAKKNARRQKKPKLTTRSIPLFSRAVILNDDFAGIVSRINEQYTKPPTHIENYKFDVCRLVTNAGELVGIKMLTLNDSEQCKTATDRITELVFNGAFNMPRGAKEAFCCYYPTTDRIEVLSYLSTPPAIDSWLIGSRWVNVKSPINQSKCDHEWNDDLSTCVKCGDKDLMG